MAHSLNKKLLIISLFSVSMALLESAVVVYLRELYYSDGFTVAFREMPQRIISVELLREFGTLMMLLTIGWIAGQTKLSRFAWFLFSFAVWDIFYYIWLKVFINWPLSLFEWDILFLLPVTWLGPVIAPVICSLTMIGLSLVIFLGEYRFQNFRISKTSWILIILGAILIYISFTIDYTSLIIGNEFYKDPSHLLQNPAFIEIAKTFVPESFSWGWFLAGELMILVGIAKQVFHRKSG